MSNLKFTYLNPKNGTLVSKTPFNSTTRYTTPSICYSKNGTVNYIPLIKPNGNITIGDKSYYYDSSDNITNKTIHCYYNNVEYVVPNKSSDLYGIPAGTYAPSAFENLIKKYISANGSRKCVNAFTAKVNGSTYHVPVGQAIRYCTTNTAGSSTNSTLRIVTFNGSKVATALDGTPTSFAPFSGTYVVYASNFSGYCTFSDYANYSITIGTGIKFK